MPTRDRVLTQRELNRALLARQLLLGRASLPLPRALERVGSIQAQYAPSMYIGLWTRLTGFERAALTRALERRAVIQATLQRVTIHLVSRRDYWPTELAVRAARRPLWLRQPGRGVTEAEMQDAARRVKGALDATPDGTMTRREVEALLGTPHAGGVGLWLSLVRVPPSGTWERRRADRYGDAERWVGPPGEATAADGVALMVRRYLTGFGPATRAEIADWCGLPVAAVRAALDGMALRRFRGPAGAELVDLPRLALPDPDTPAPVRFLPTFDATLLAHARRTQILPEVYRARIFHTKMPQSVGTFLVDGQVAGIWRAPADDGRVRWEAFTRLDAATRREVAQEADALSALHA